MERKTVKEETIVLDGKVITSTDFNNCLILYKGGTPPLLKDNSFVDCAWKFEDEARNTVEFLTALIHSAGGDDSAKKFVLENILGVKNEASAEPSNK